MGVVWLRVSSLTQLQELLAAGEPHPIVFIGVERVRSAPEMVRLVDATPNKILPVAEGKVAIFNYFCRGSSDEEVDDADEADAAAAADDDPNSIGYWIVEGLPSVRRVAELARIATELADEVLPALAASPADLLILKRLRELGRDVRRAGRLEPGAAGARAVILGNRAQKVAYRARRHSAVPYRGRRRSVLSRTTYVGDRLAELTAKVNAVLDTAVVFEAD